MEITGFYTKLDGISFDEYMSAYSNSNTNSRN